MLTGQCRRRLGKPYSKDQDTLPSLPRNSFESNGNFPQIESAAFPHSCQPTLAPDSDPITSETDSVETTKDSESSIHLCNHPSGYSLIEPDFRCIADVLSHAI